MGVVTLQSSSFNADFYDLSKFSIKKYSFYLYKDINDNETKKWIKKMNLILFSVLDGQGYKGGTS